MNHGPAIQDLDDAPFDARFWREVEVLRGLIRRLPANRSRRPVPGRSGAFLEHRRAEPPVGVRDIDWAAFASGRGLLEKRYEMVRPPELLVAVDATGSMGAVPERWRLARQLAYALCLLGLDGHRTITLVAMMDGDCQLLGRHRSPGEHHAIGRGLLGLVPTGRSDMAGLARHTGRGGATVIISDLIAMGGLEAELRALIAHRQRPTFIHMASTLSPPAGRYDLVDAETGEVRRLSLTGADVLAALSRRADQATALIDHLLAAGVGVIPASGHATFERVVRQLMQLGVLP